MAAFDRLIECTPAELTAILSPKTPMKTVSATLIALTLGVAITTVPAIAADAAALEAAFKKLDTNTDGTLSLDEFKASPEGVKDPEKAQKQFKKLDANTDGTLSLDEFKAQ